MAWSNKEIYQIFQSEIDLACLIRRGFPREDFEDEVTERLLFAAKEAYKAFSAASHSLELHLESTVSGKPPAQCGRLDRSRMRRRVCVRARGHEGEHYFGEN